jgi:nucleotide-binding universal stress UspA family protein
MATTVGVAGGNARWDRIAVAVDSYADSLVVVPEAVAAARAHHARLTIICVAPRPWPTVAHAGVCPLRLEAEATVAAAAVVHRLAAALPPDMPCTTYARCGPVARSILEILRRDCTDVLFIASATPGRRSGLHARRVVQRLLRHSPADLVVLG